MEIDGLLLPDLLTSMIATGRWPSASSSINQQHLQTLIPSDRNRKLRGICLYPPPFRTLSNARTDEFYRAVGVNWKLVPELAIAIADFGIGSDSPILLYYQQNNAEPTVLNLNWQEGHNSTSWVVMAENFAAFVELLGI